MSIEIYSKLAILVYAKAIFNQIFNCLTAAEGSVVPAEDHGAHQGVAGRRSDGEEQTFSHRCPADRRTQNAVCYFILFHY